MAPLPALRWLATSAGKLQDLSGSQIVPARDLREAWLLFKSAAPKPGRTPRGVSVARRLEPSSLGDPTLAPGVRVTPLQGMPPQRAQSARRGPRPGAPRMPGHQTSRREVRVSDAAKPSCDAEMPRGVRRVSVLRSITSAGSSPSPCPSPVRPPACRGSGSSASAGLPRLRRGCHTSCL